MTDKEYFSVERLKNYVNTNEHLLDGKKPIGIVVEFPGNGGGSCLGGHCDNEKYETLYARELAKEGILLVYAEVGPKSFMHKGAVKFTDYCLDALLEKFGLDASTPIIATGGSMGGFGALSWSFQTRQNVRGCAAACPGTNMLRDFAGTPWRPRCLLGPYLNYDCSLEEALASSAPDLNVDKMKDIPYYIVADVDDNCFDIKYTDKFVEMLRGRNFCVDYRRLDDLKHGEFTTEARGDLTKFVIKTIKDNQ